MTYSLPSAQVQHYRSRCPTGITGTQERRKGRLSKMLAPDREGTVSGRCFRSVLWMCGIYLRPLLQWAATFPLPPPMSRRSSRPPPAAPRHLQTPSRDHSGCLPDCPLMGCDCVRLWWNCHKSGNLCALLRKNAVIAAKSPCERNKICYLLCSCLFGRVFGSFILSAEGNPHFNRTCLLCVLIGPFHTVANVLL